MTTKIDSSVECIFIGNCFIFFFKCADNKDTVYKNTIILFCRCSQCEEPSCPLEEPGSGVLSHAPVTSV